jgi:hypothetical protein
VHNRTGWAWTVVWFALAACSAYARGDAASSGANSILITLKDGQQHSYSAEDIVRLELKPPAMIVFKDGHHQTLSPDIARIEFKSSASTPILGRNHFLGKWKVGDGAGGTLIMTLDRDGRARKSNSSPRGTWTVVDGEAHITWDDGWKDIIRKVGNKHEKVAFRPGKSFSDEPSNVTTATNETAEPI